VLVPLQRGGGFCFILFLLRRILNLAAPSEFLGLLSLSFQQLLQGIQTEGLFAFLEAALVQGMDDVLCELQLTFR
jgi:hypothetical protein